MITAAETKTDLNKDIEAWVFQPGQIPHAWEELEPLIAKSIVFSHGELTLEDARTFLLQGGMTAFAIAKDGEIQLMMLVEIVIWPQYKAARVVGLAGKGMIEARPFRSMFEAWCLAQGAVEIEAWTQPVTSRMLRSLGFVKTYEVVRLDLRSKLQ